MDWKVGSAAATSSGLGSVTTRETSCEYSAGRGWAVSCALVFSRDLILWALISAVSTGAA